MVFGELIHLLPYSHCSCTFSFSIAHECIDVPVPLKRIRLKDVLISLNDKKSNDVESEMISKMGIVKELKDMPVIAIDTDLANEQHYEVPTSFYDLCLGPRKKYSSGLWPSMKTTFAESEELMLDLYCKRANVKDGMKIVDLGCGWGSVTLYVLEKYPNCKVTSISNSNSQREYIMSRAKSHPLIKEENLTVITCNISDQTGKTDELLKNVTGNDLVISIEMFEHMKNYSMLLKKVNGFLRSSSPDEEDPARLFIHIFTHKDYTYHFEEGDWMADNFFSGGTMPSDDLMLYFPEHFSVEKHWRVNGSNYEKTSNAWLETLDKSWKVKKGKDEVGNLLFRTLRETYGEGKENEWYVNWRLFFLACAELWGYDSGNEWIVSHYLFRKRG